jgi:hypothetical protein
MAGQLSERHRAWPERLQGDCIMLIVTAESGTYPPDGRIPDLDENGDAFAYCFGKVAKLLPEGRQEAVMGILVTWSADSWTRPPFTTWQDAVRAAETGKTRDVAPKTASQMSKDAELTGEEEDALKKGLASTDTTSDKNIVLRDESRRFANCGMAAFNILETLRKKGAKLTHEPARIFTAGQQADLGKLLMQVPAVKDEVLMLDCQWRKVHNFLIEIHPDGRRYLAQGYQGTYFAAWWLAIDDSLYSGEPDPRIAKFRQQYGCGQPLGNYEEFAIMICETVSQDSWVKVSKIWPSLPFNPEKYVVEGVAAQTGIPEFQVEVYTLSQVGALYDALHAKVGERSISELAVRAARDK